jgi:hypothetical protein
VFEGLAALRSYFSAKPMQLHKHMTNIRAATIDALFGNDRPSDNLKKSKILKTEIGTAQVVSPIPLDPHINRTALSTATRSCTVWGGPSSLQPMR